MNFYGKNVELNLELELEVVRLCGKGLDFNVEFEVVNLY